MLKIGPNIKVLRERLGLSQQDFAAKIGVKKQHVSNWERNINGISHENLDLIMKAFSLRYNDIIDISNEPKMAVEEPSETYNWRRAAEDKQRIIEMLDIQVEKLKHDLELCLRKHDKLKR